MFGRDNYGMVVFGGNCRYTLTCLQLQTLFWPAVPLFPSLTAKKRMKKYGGGVCVDSVNSEGIVFCRACGKLLVAPRSGARVLVCVCGRRQYLKGGA